MGAVHAAIRHALAGVRPWTPEFPDLDQARTVLPPGFSEGRPGAFLRATRVLLHVDAVGTIQGLYEHLRKCPTEAAFQDSGGGLRLSDVIDLTWMDPGPIELQSVQEFLYLLTAAVLPGEPLQFSLYDEPRYRAALRLTCGRVPLRLAHGGVVWERKGRPSDTGIAHLRLFLEAWAAVRTGGAVEFDALPDIRPAAS